MFGLFKKKERKNHYQLFEPSITKSPESINQLNPLKEEDGFTRLNPEQIKLIHETLNPEEFNQYYTESLLPGWLNALGENLGGNYQTYTSKSFYLITCEPEKFVSTFLKSMENIRHRIIQGLGSLHLETDERLPVIIINDVEEYYAYISHFYPEEGTFAESGGVFLKALIPHFVFPQVSADGTIATASHELTHALLSHQELPIWLDEGMAVNMEATITNFNPFRLTQEKHNKHIEFWGEEEIQQFWSGHSFSRPDEGNELSYQLAQLITRSLAENHEAFYSFVEDASYQDGGEASLIKHYGISLGDIVKNVFGEGNWKPAPEKWQNE